MFFWAVIGFLAMEAIALAALLLARFYVSADAGKTLADGIFLAV
ncbi:MAG: hypothetical protein Tsb0010_04640 [Parvularculaceae bacterium]